MNAKLLQEAAGPGLSGRDRSGTPQPSRLRRAIGSEPGKQAGERKRPGGKSVIWRWNSASGGLGPARRGVRAEGPTRQAAGAVWQGRGLRERDPDGDSGLLNAKMIGLPGAGRSIEKTFGKRVSGEGVQVFVLRLW
ncbi:MAG: hypothetical protein K9L68_06730 [Spirochaetales bacterium]|nr:hypothetical protein [Spirochaetales bacterium]MCF7938279.1 hypothetical protein [Spirochaetales bacterium]